MLSNAFNSISSWRNYRATPLLKLNKLQKNLKLNNIGRNNQGYKNNDAISTYERV